MRIKDIFNGLREELYKTYRYTVPLARVAAPATAVIAGYYILKGADKIRSHLIQEAPHVVGSNQQSAYVTSSLVAMGITDTIYAGIRANRLRKDGKANILDYAAVVLRLPAILSPVINQYLTDGDLVKTVMISLGSIGAGYILNGFADTVRYGWKKAPHIRETISEKLASGSTLFIGSLGLLASGLAAGYKAWSISTTYTPTEIHNSVGNQIIETAGTALFVTSALDSMNAIAESRNEKSILRRISTGFRLLPLLTIPAVGIATHNPFYTLAAGLVPMWVGYGLKVMADIRKKHTL